jgi:hypothetical protein
MITTLTKQFILAAILSIATGLSPLFAQSARLSADTKNGDSTSYYLNLVLDPLMNMRSGAETMVGLHRGWSIGEDQLIGTSWFDESRFLGKTGGILARAGKLVFLDIPVDYFTVVLAHELFGHGARYREFNYGPVDYGFSWPPPYGPGSGHASLSHEGLINYNKHLSIWTGGLEVHPLLNRQLTFKWMATNRMHYREASLYFWSSQIYMNYIQSSITDLSTVEDLNDPQAYISILNAAAGYTDLDDLMLSMEDLQSKVLINMANPFLYYSLYSIIKTYLWDGNSDNGLPRIRVGRLYYLPLLRAGMSPFGIEYHVENYFHRNSQNFLLAFRLGDQTITDRWYALGLHAHDLVRMGPVSFNLYLEAWKQPELVLAEYPVFTHSQQFGMGGSVRSYYHFPGMNLPAQAFVELGYKSKGFIEGYDLDASLIFSFGAGIKL